MERKRELTKILLAESFKELLIKGSFDKITIKMITDQAGVIRPTLDVYKRQVDSSCQSEASASAYGKRKHRGHLSP